MQNFQCWDCSKTVRFVDSDIHNDFEVLTDRERQQVGFHYLIRGRATKVIVCGPCFDVREGLNFDMPGIQTVLEEERRMKPEYDYGTILESGRSAPHKAQP